MKRALKAAILSLSLSSIPINLFAKGVGSSGGLILEPASARASALGDSFTSATNDINALGYNPSALNTLTSGQASFLYEKGLVDDTFSQFVIGSPLKRGGLGLQIGHYNGGDLELSDGAGVRSVRAQSDLALTLALAHEIRGVSVGVAGKYLSSELAETARAQAFALDLGMSVPVGSRFRLGGAVQNIGTELKYQNDGDPLPRSARGGLSYLVVPQGYVTTLLVDVNYLMNERLLEPSLGLETVVGPLALRAGYKRGVQNNVSLGTGFAFGRSSLDYAFALGSRELDTEHRLSFSMKFGSGAPVGFSQAPASSDLAQAPIGVLAPVR